MKRWQRRTLRTITFLTALMLLASVMYHVTMVTVEGRSQSYIHSLQVVIETFTGTGFGSDSPWETFPANALIVAIDLTTFLLLFIVVPYIFRPILEEALSLTLPTGTEKTDHVVIIGVDQQDERLIEELDTRGIPYVVVVEDEAEAKAFYDEETPVINGDPTATETARRAGVDRARAVVIDIADKRSTSVILAVRAVDDAVTTIALVNDTAYERHLTYAGADTVLTPRRLLGRRIAERVQTELIPGVSDIVEIDDGVALTELSVFEDSSLTGVPIGALSDHIAEEVTVIGCWEEGSFNGSPARDRKIDPNTGFLVRGSTTALRQLESLAHRDVEDRSVVIAGRGVVGTTVAEELTAAGIDPTVIDTNETVSTDANVSINIVGDATTEATLTQAGIESASVFVCAIAPDEQVIHSVLVATRLGDPDTIARVNDPGNDQKVRRAGADYVLALPEISGRILALEVLRGEILSYDRQLRIERVTVDRFAGRTLAQTPVLEGDRVVVAIERDGRIDTEFTPETTLTSGDRLIVVGSDPTPGEQSDYRW